MESIIKTIIHNLYELAKKGETDTIANVNIIEKGFKNKMRVEK